MECLQTEPLGPRFVEERVEFALAQHAFVQVLPSLQPPRSCSSLTVNSSYTPNNFDNSAGLTGAIGLGGMRTPAVCILAVIV
jgi:hypothetical protein